MGKVRNYKLEDYIGKKHGLLTCVSVDYERMEAYKNKNGFYDRCFLMCECACDEDTVNMKSIDFSNFKNNQVVSCGCIQKRIQHEKAKEKALRNYSLYDWCIENNQERIIELFDNDKNCCTIEEVCAKSAQLYWFKCDSCEKEYMKIKPCDVINRKRKLECDYCKSFYKWCLDNDRMDFIERWDYELNNIDPKIIVKGNTTNLIYFKCARGLHESTCIKLFDVTENSIKNEDYKLKCNKCNSIGQYLLDMYGDNALDTYWDYKNNVYDPFSIQHGNSDIHVYIKCVNTEYHGSYKTLPNSFTNPTTNNRCPYCSNQKIHILDSLGTLFPNTIDIWSDKNKKSPYEYSPNSGLKVWWKCPKGEHSDYYRNMYNSQRMEFRCPRCYIKSKGEIKIEEILKEYDIKYDTQKEYQGLIGLGGRNLSYDFYLTDYNLLIEYQGCYHDGNAPRQSEKEFEVQQEHDKRKKQYALYNKINLFEIWYLDYGKIKDILINELKL